MKPTNNLNSTAATPLQPPSWNYQQVCNTIEAGAAAGTAVCANRTWNSQKRQEKAQIMKFAESSRQMVEKGTMRADRAKEMLEDLGVNPQYIDGQSFHMMASPGLAGVEYVPSLGKKALRKWKSPGGQSRPTASLSSLFFSVRESESGTYVCAGDSPNRQEGFVGVEENPIPPRQGKHPCSFPDSFVGNSLAALVGIFLLFWFKYSVRKIVKLFYSAKQPKNLQ